MQINVKSEATSSAFGNGKESSNAGIIVLPETPRIDLLDAVLLNSVNAHCFFEHSIRFLHLLQSGNQHVYV